MCIRVGTEDAVRGTQDMNMTDLMHSSGNIRHVAVGLEMLM